MHVKTKEEILAEVDAKMHQQMIRDADILALGYWMGMMHVTRQFESFGGFQPFVTEWIDEHPNASFQDVASAMGLLYQSWRESL